MESVQILIDSAVKKAGSQSALGRAIGWEATSVSKLQAGKRPWTPEIVGVLCDYVGLTGEQARYLAALVVVEAAKNSSKAEVLRRAFFLLVVAGALAFCPINDSKANSAFIQYSHIELTIYKSSRILTWFQMLDRMAVRLAAVYKASLSSGVFA